MKSYEIHEEITKEVLDKVQVDDLVKCNQWGMPYRVKGVSQNYFIMTRRMFGKQFYSICEKKLWGGTAWKGIRNSMKSGMFHIGPDNWIFGYPGVSYDFNDAEDVEVYLKSLEEGETTISHRRGCPLTRIAIKHTK